MRQITHTAKVLLGLGVIYVLVLTIAGSVDSVAKETVTSPSAQLQQAYGKLPLSFEANQGQTDEHVKFLSRGRGYTLFLAQDEAVLVLREKSQAQVIGKNLSPIAHSHSPAEPTVLRMQFEGANPSPLASGLEPLPGIVNYFIGNDPKKWRTNIPTYQKVQYKDIYPASTLFTTAATSDNWNTTSSSPPAPIPIRSS